jgi:hypothetical protein
LARIPIFSNYSFGVHHPVNRDDQHLLAHAMASDFSVSWQFLSKRNIVFFSLWIKLHAQECPFFTICPLWVVFRPDGLDSTATVIKPAGHWDDLKILILVVSSYVYTTLEKCDRLGKIF